MSFSKEVKEQVLLKCKRYCCYCERYKGVNIEIHHIDQKADGGEDTFDNAIPLCFDCHSEIGSYNPRHPKGNRFKPGELKRIRDEFYRKIESVPRKLLDISEHDEELLKEFKKDYTSIIEYAIYKDFSSELVDADYGDKIYYLQEEKWSRKKYCFNDTNLESLKIDILQTLENLRTYLSSKYLRYHKDLDKLIFRNQSFEEGNRLRDELRPRTIELRRRLNELLEKLYMYE